MNNDIRVSHVYNMVDYMCFVMQTLIEQNQDQARQILIQNPLLTKALFQVIFCRLGFLFYIITFVLVIQIIRDFYRVFKFGVVKYRVDAVCDTSAMSDLTCDLWRIRNFA